MRGRDLLALCVLALVLRLVALWALPLGAREERFECAPDEAGHFWVAAELANGRLPTWPDTSWTIKGSFPPLQYAAQAMTLLPVRFGFDPGWLYRAPVVVEEVQGYPLARLGSALLGVLTVVLLAQAAFEVTASREAGLAVGAMAALYPQFVFVGAYANGDAMTVAAGAVLVFGFARFAAAGEGERGLLWIAVGVALVLQGKPTGFGLLPASGVWVLWAWRTGRLSTPALSRAVALGLLVCGPLLLWNAVRNGGDPLGLWLYRDYLGTGYVPRAGTGVPGALGTFLTVFPASAFGVFRNVDLPLPAPFFVVAGLFLVVGLLLAAREAASASALVRRAGAWLASSLAITLGLAAWNAWLVDFQPQGRYALLCVLLLTGVALWGPVAGGRRFGRPWLWGYLAFLAVAALWTEWLLFSNPCL